MIYILDNLEHWQKKFGIKPYSRACLGCGEMTEVFRPILGKELHGLCSDPHEPCGNKYRIYHLQATGNRQSILREAVATGVFEIDDSEFVPSPFGDD